MDFEKAFSDFIDKNEYDDAQQALFKITRDAFKAGWKAAYKNYSTADKILNLKEYNKND